MQSSEDAIFLQKALYDAVILIDHSYLQPHTCIQSVDGYSRNLALVWSIVADNAICLARYVESTVVQDSSVKLYYVLFVNV